MLLNNSTLYIFINKDLKMSNGKILSQTVHLTNKIFLSIFSKAIIKQHISTYIQWCENGERVIVLKSSQIEMEKLIKYTDINIWPIYDAGRTQVKKGSLTLLGLGPICDKTLQQDFARFKLF